MGLVLSGAIVGAFILVFILILMTGIWVGRFTFWNISWLLWSVAFPFTAFVFAVFMVFLNYGTKTITSYALSTYVFDRFGARAGRLRWLLLILGLIIYVMLRAIPTLGWVIAVVVTAWGIGAAWLARQNRRALAASVAAAAAVPVVPDPPTAVADDLIQ